MYSEKLFAVIIAKPFDTNCRRVSSFLKYIGSGLLLLLMCSLSVLPLWRGWKFGKCVSNGIPG